jgi:hypothetical protein
MAVNYDYGYCEPQIMPMYTGRFEFGYKKTPVS